MIVGSSTALLRPCGTWKCAPIGRLIPWTSATEALEKAAPASIAPSMSASRASSSPPSDCARRRYVPMSSAARSAKPSVTGFAFAET